MFLFIAVGVLLLIPAIVLHYSSHFKLSTSFKRNNILPRYPSTSSPTNNKQSKSTKHPQCCCGLESIDDEDFNFFPISFLCYMLFILFIYLLKITIEIINNYHYENNPDVFSTDISYSNNSIYKLHNINTNTNPIYVYICDYILIYGVLILSLWESLFSFYRYYTTFVTSNDFQLTSTLSVMFRFSIFGIIFSIIYIVQMHLYYWLFPIVIILYYSFNWYFTWKFASILIKQCKLFTAFNKNENENNNIHHDMLKSVYYMRKVSLVCCILQSISLTIFIIIYNVAIIDYLAILWSISCIVFGFNFVRNRFSAKKCASSIQILCAKFRNKKDDNAKKLTQSFTDEKTEDTAKCTPDAVYVENTVVVAQNPKVPVKTPTSLTHRTFGGTPISFVSHIGLDKTANENDDVHNINTGDDDNMDNDDIEFDIEDSPPATNLALPQSRPLPLKLKHNKSNSMPIDIDAISSKDTGKLPVHLPTATNANDDIIFEIDIPEDTPPIEENEKKSNKPPLPLKHVQSNSLPINFKEFDAGEILQSFNKLTKYGFCKPITNKDTSS